MAVLIRILIILVWSAWPLFVQASSRPLLDYEFSGYVQGRLTAFLINTQKVPGPLNDLLDPDLAGGEYETMGTIKRLEFSLSTKLNYAGWKTNVTGTVFGTKAKIKTAMLQWKPNNRLTLLAGLIPIPFGLEQSISSSSLATIERSLIYSFGNFGWVDSLGLHLIDQYAHGARLNLRSSNHLWGFLPYLNAAVVTGSGRQVSPRYPTQVVVKAGLNSLQYDQPFRYHIKWSFSGSYGWNQFEQRFEKYIPVGISGDLLTAPEKAVQIDYLGRDGFVALLGSGLNLRLADLLVTHEWIWKKIHRQSNYGYYLQAQLELFNYIETDLELVVKWEEIIAQLADGVHRPGTRYQALTMGMTWTIISNWMMQLNYIRLYQNSRPHSFTGSDLLISQLQWRF